MVMRSTILLLLLGVVLAACTGDRPDLIALDIPRPDLADAAGDAALEITVDVVDLAPEHAPDICVAACDDKACGDDGCGGQCGECEMGNECIDGACVCTPACDSAVCGDDGCGGSCGECADNQSCTDGQCACAFLACVDKCCADGEVCPEDSGECCLPDCEGKDCGSDGCDAECGECGENQECGEGLCSCTFESCAEACCAEGEVCAEDSCCMPDCQDKVCGGDGCGGSCGDCQELQECTEDGQCECLFAGCAESCCPEGQVCFEDACCQPQCDGKLCGDDTCGGLCAECEPGYKCTEEFTCVCAFEGCGEDCCGAGEICTEAGCCKPDCDGKECGDSGCGTQCGECGENKQCDNFGCICSFLECGGDCCGEPQICHQEACCTPDCDGKDCGSDGCGGSCGDCGEYELCGADQLCECEILECLLGCCGPDHVCFEDQCCQPTCVGVVCGTDGCGGDCGGCDPGCYCGGGMCLGSCNECVPDCENNECGWDGCGEKCGECAPGDNCNIDTWLCEDGECQFPTEYPGQHVKWNYLKSGMSGYEGQAVEVDNDPTTCAPKGMCDGGRDNQFAALMKSLAPMLSGTEPLMDALNAGDIVMLVQFVEPKFDGSPFLSNLYRGVPEVSKAECDFQEVECEYKVHKKSFVTETCQPITAFDNTQMAGTTITAGGPGYKFEFPFVLALTGGQEVTLPATHAKIVADLVFDDDQNIIGMSGVIGCAVPKSAFMDMIASIPEEALPVAKDLVMMLMDAVVIPDIDVDGDGTKESVSTGLVFSAISANITGLQP